MSVLTPLSHALAAVVAAAHAGLTSLGADPSSGPTWVLCIAAVVAVVRLALLPLAVHGVRLAHASARARPQLQELTERYRSRTDAASLRAFAEERRGIAAEHDLSRWGSLPLLVQIPIWIALYHLMAAGRRRDVGRRAELRAGGVPGRGDPARGSAGRARLSRRRLDPSGRGRRARGDGGGAVLRHPAVPGRTEHRPRRRARGHGRIQQLLPMVSAVGLLVAGGVVPVALLVYWVCNGAWTLGQSAVVWRWFPTPGHPRPSDRGP